MKMAMQNQNQQQNDQDESPESKYPPDGTPGQSVPAKGPGFQPIRPPVPPGQRGKQAVASLQLKALLAALHKQAMRGGRAR